MPDNFFDTSALGKHYHAEIGTAKVDQLLADPASRQFITRLTLVEIQSVFAKKVRTGVLPLGDFQLLCRRFLADVRRRKFHVARVASAHFLAAEQLLRRLGPNQNLRTLDAIQLAVALNLQRQGLIHQVVCADRILCSLAAAEGLIVVNPEAP